MSELHLIISVLAVIWKETQCVNFRMVWMAPSSVDNEFSAGSSVGALKLAMDDVTTVLADTFTENYRNADCGSKMALSHIYDAIIRDQFAPDVIIGPPCSDAMAFVAQLAGYRNIPILGWISDSPDFGNIETYNTLIRTFPAVNIMARGLLQVLQEYGWKRVLLLSSTGNPYHNIGTAVSAELLGRTADGYTVTRWIDLEPINPDADKIDEVYKIVRKEARVVVMIVPQAELRSWMLRADDNSMTSGDFVFIYLNPELATDLAIFGLQDQSIWQKGDGQDDKAQRAFENLLILTPKSYEPATSFSTKADASALTYAPSLGLTASPVDDYAGYLYDAVRLYAKLANEAIDDGADHKDGTELFNRAKMRLFNNETEFVTSPILLDENGDRLPDFWLLDLSTSGDFSFSLSIESTLSAAVIQTTRVELLPVRWGDGSEGKDNAPKDVPDCGFTNELCLVRDLVPLIVPPVVIGVVIIIAVAAFLINRKLQFERSLKDMSWKLDPKDLKSTKKKDNGTSLLQVSSRCSSMRKSKQSVMGSHDRSHVSLCRMSATVSMASSAADDRSQIFVNIVQYKTDTVAIRHIRKAKIKIDRNLMVEMRMMAGLKHSNLAQLVGVTTDPGMMMEVWEYCSKGSLQDVIWNDNITFEDMFRYSVAIDIFKGLSYLHESPIKLHGRLKSSNCVIDGRWVCKLTDYGLFELRAGSEDDPDMTEFSKYTRLLWTAPELLRTASKDFKIKASTPEADMYSGGIILKEIFARNGPFTEHEDDMEPDEIIGKIMSLPTVTSPPFRPLLTDVKGQAPDRMLEVIRSAWSEKPADRPSPSHVIKELQRINPNRSANVMDNMVQMMERYTNHLEEIVNERTEQVEVEKKKSEMLLYRMLPKPIAEDLKRGKSIEAESYDSVSIYFSDIVKFTTLSAQSTPMQVVGFLNKLYTIFDSAIAMHDVYKVETIGDAYMLVSGLPERNGDRHAVEIANCAMDLLSGILDFKVAHMPEDYVIELRIGLHTGPTVAGVVGLTMPRYCLFGNTVTVAQTMESGGQPMRIHLSQNTYDILKKYSGYYLAARNEPMDLKGLGKTNTYWLLNRDGYNKPMPDFSLLAEEDNPRPTIFPVTRGHTFRPSVTESGIFEMDANDLSRKTSQVNTELGQVIENSQENLDVKTIDHNSLLVNGKDVDHVNDNRRKSQHNERKLFLQDNQSNHNNDHDVFLLNELVDPKNGEKTELIVNENENYLSNIRANEHLGRERKKKKKRKKDKKERRERRTRDHDLDHENEKMNGDETWANPGCAEALRTPEIAQKEAPEHG